METINSRDLDARRAGRLLGGLMNMYVTGDPGSDSIAEYMAAGWLYSEDYYNEDDQPRDKGTALVAALRDQARALDRLAAEIDRGDVNLDQLGYIDLPRQAR